MADDRTLAFLGELERADTESAELLAELDGLAAEVDALRLRAVEVEAFLLRLPAERERLGGGRVEAARRVKACRNELATAERELEAAERDRDERRIAAARHLVRRSLDAPHTAERVAGEADAELERLESNAATVERETSELVERAARLADDLRNRPRIAETAGAFSGCELAAVAEWAGTARAALFVARASLAAEREALIRQANELAAVVLGERVFSGGAAEVARRVRRSG